MPRYGICKRVTLFFEYEVEADSPEDAHTQSHGVVPETRLDSEYPGSMYENGRSVDHVEANGTSDETDVYELKRDGSFGKMVYTDDGPED